MKRADNDKSDEPEVTRKTLIINDLKELFYRLSGRDKSQMDEDTAFSELGFDHLFLNQVKSIINKNIPLNIHLSQAHGISSNFNSLASYLDEKLPASSYRKELEMVNRTDEQTGFSPLIENPESVIASTKVNYAIHTESTPDNPDPESAIQTVIEQQMILMQQQMSLLQRLDAMPDDQKGKVKIEEIDLNNNTPLQEILSNTSKLPDHSESKTEKTLNGVQSDLLRDFILKYTSYTQGSRTLFQEDQLKVTSSASGLEKPWKAIDYPIAVKHSKGSKFRDIDGHNYIDFTQNSMLFGRAPEFMINGISRQFAKGITKDTSRVLTNKAAGLLCAVCKTENAFFTDRSSKALATAVRVAQASSKKDKIIVFEGDDMGVESTEVQNIILLNYLDPNILLNIKKQQDQIAAVLINPFPLNHPVFQSTIWIETIRKICSEYNIALIFNEIETGFRLALRGAQEWLAVEADILVYGNIISGGLPLSAVAFKSKYLSGFQVIDKYQEEAISSEKRFPQALNLAAAIAFLTKIKKEGPELYEALNSKSALFFQQINELFLKTKVPFRIRSVASIFFIERMDNQILSPLLFYYLNLKGIHIKEKAASISTEHTVEELNHTVKMFEESIEAMLTAGFFNETVAEAGDHKVIITPPSQQTLTVSATPPVFKQKLPLTEAQKEIWIEHQISVEAAATFNLGSVFHLKGDLKVDKLEAAFQQLVQGHEALRVDFLKNERSLNILSHRKITMPILNIAELAEDKKKAYLDDLRDEEAEKPIDIFNEMPFRAKLVKVGEKEHYFFFTLHQIIADEWAMNVLMRDLSSLFTKECGAIKIQLPEPQQLRDFVKNQNVLTTDKNTGVALDYWKAQFNDGMPLLEFPTDFIRPVIKTYASAVQGITIPEDLYKRLKTIATAEKTTFFNLIYTAFQVLIYRLSHQEDFILGITENFHSKKDRPYLQAQAANLLPVRLQTSPDHSFIKTLQVTNTKLFDAVAHKSLSFGNLLKALKIHRNPARTPLISILINKDVPAEDFQFSDLEVEVDPIPRNYESFDIFINLKPVGNSLSIEWIYNKDLFHADTIGWRLRELETLLKNIAKDARQSVGKIIILPEEERKLLIEDFNPPLVSRPERVIHQYLEDHAVSIPDRIAIADANREMTYHQLNQRANQVAHYFIAQGVYTGNFVGVYFDRTVDMVVALMACMKIGAVYVPLDPLNPTDRLKVIIEDVEADFLITQESLIDTLPSDFKKVICFDRDEARIRACSTSNLFKKIKTSHLVYVNYTSGSTGKPKGVLIPHSAVVDHHLSMIKALQLSSEDKIFSVASIAFDPSVLDFFLPLMIGAQVYIAGEMEKRDGFQLKAALEKVQPTIMQATPATWQMLLMSKWEGSKNLTILCGGEALQRSLSQKLMKRCRRLYNLYGPTETTIWSTLKLLEGDRLQNNADTTFEPIGRPIENVQIYLLDAHQQAVPIGAAGEIYIGGSGVAPNGYFKRDSLNEEKFIINPFQNTPGQKIYRSGDIARYLYNGDLEYLRRADTQVKIRGFRIELGEIEATIAQFENIREAAVAIRKDQNGSDHLIAYCILENSKKLNFGDLKVYLKTKLPDYMIPDTFLELDHFPLTPTMKVNRSLLPVPVDFQIKKEHKFIPASSKNEKILSSIWQELLGVSSISMDDDFFDLGGYSLAAVNMIAMIEKQTGQVLPLSVFLKNTTIQQLARHLK